MRSLAIIGLLVVAVGCGGKATTAERVATYGEAVKARLSPAFAAQGKRPRSFFQRGNPPGWLNATLRSKRN